MTEYRADHTRLMDGESLNPPRTWHLEGDRLTHVEESGTDVCKVVSLDQSHLVLAGEDGKHYAYQRVLAPRSTKTAPKSPASAALVSTAASPNLELTAAASGESQWATGSWPLVLYKNDKMPWPFPLPGYWHLMKQPYDANATMSWLGPKGIMITLYSFDKRRVGDFWSALNKSARIVHLKEITAGQQAAHDNLSGHEYEAVAEVVEGLQLRFVSVLQPTARSGKSVALCVSAPPDTPQVVLHAAEFMLGYCAGYGAGAAVAHSKMDTSLRVTTKNDPLLAELSKLGSAQNIVPTAGNIPRLLTKAQWKDKMAHNFRYFPGTPVIGSAQQFQQVMGKPERTQTVGDLEHGS